MRKIPARHKLIIKFYSRTQGHQTQWVNACKKGFGAYTSSSFEKSGPLIETVLMGNLAVKSYNYQEKNSKGEIIYPGRKQLLWHGENQRITNLILPINL